MNIEIRRRTIRLAPASIFQLLGAFRYACLEIGAVPGTKVDAQEKKDIKISVKIKSRMIKCLYSRQ